MIYGVGMDSAKEAWLKAIEKDGRSGSMFLRSRDLKRQLVTSLPTNVLIDKSGKEIARNLHGNDLKEIIEKLFLK